MSQAPMDAERLAIQQANMDMLTIAGAGLVRDPNLVSGMLLKRIASFDPLLIDTTAFALKEFDSPLPITESVTETPIGRIDYNKNARIEEVIRVALHYAAPLMKTPQPAEAPNNELLNNALQLGHILDNMNSDDYATVLIAAEGVNIWGPFVNEAEFVRELLRIRTAQDQILPAVTRHLPALTDTLRDARGMKVGNMFLGRIIGDGRPDISYQTKDNEPHKVQIVNTILQSNQQMLAKATYYILDCVNSFNATPSLPTFEASTLGGMFDAVIAEWKKIPQAQIDNSQIEQAGLDKNLLALLHDSKAQSAKGTEMKKMLLDVIFEKLK